MGAYLSRYSSKSVQDEEDARSEAADGGNSSSSPSPAPVVLEFHTKASWRAHWEAQQQSRKLMVVDFKASWCGPCRAIEPFVRDLAAQHAGNVAFVRLDVDELQDLTAEWKVEAMPTFVMVKGGREVGRLVGADKEQLKAMVARGVAM